MWKLFEKQNRLDKWLWYCRFYKSRSIASQAIKSGKFRVNGNKVDKSSMLLREGDIIIFSHGKVLRAVEVVLLGEQRLASEKAVKLYREVSIG